jgi:hypothetical protein
MVMTNPFGGRRPAPMRAGDDAHAADKPRPARAARPP